MCHNAAVLIRPAVISPLLSFWLARPAVAEEENARLIPGISSTTAWDDRESVASLYQPQPT